MKSARFLSIISNKDVFPNPDMLITVLEKTPLSTKRYFDYETYHSSRDLSYFKRKYGVSLFYCCDNCCDCWLNKSNNYCKVGCHHLIVTSCFNNLIGDKNIIIEMKRFLDAKEC